MEKGAVNIWMIAFLVLAGAVLFVAGSFFPNLLKNFTAKTINPSPQPAVTQSVTPTTATGEITTPVLITPTTAAKSDIELIKQAFAVKYSRPVADIDITINKNNGTHASGSIKFAGEMGGGWFLAFKEGESWKIVQDGNGTVSCEAIAPYNFPKDMAPECVNSAGNLITR